ncbi:hypothetical protein EKH55_5684 (plasmid) [Sinorhizobium alkalisoli]|nr:hypothetical protein EKH55_5684 [Sinorhizobium alkalisoli]
MVPLRETIDHPQSEPKEPLGLSTVVAGQNGEGQKMPDHLR